MSKCTTRKDSGVVPDPLAATAQDKAEFAAAIFKELDGARDAVVTPIARELLARLTPEQVDALIAELEKPVKSS